MVQCSQSMAIITAEICSISLDRYSLSGAIRRILLILNIKQYFGKVKLLILSNAQYMAGVDTTLGGRFNKVLVHTEQKRLPVYCQYTDIYTILGGSFQSVQTAVS